MDTSHAVQREAVIDISDLRQPILSELQRRAVETAPPVRLEEEVVLEEARQATGLHDFGSPDIHERLKLWLRCARNDRELSRVGQARVFRLALRYMSNRLLVEDMVKRHPEILDIEIERPLVIAGLPRSGTTHLQNFLAADSRWRSLPFWEAIRPVPAPGEDARPGEADPRHVKCAEEWQRADALMPYIKAMHEFSPDHISEDVELQDIDLGSYYLEWIADVPEWRDYCETHDATHTYRYLKKCLQVLNYLTGTKRWLLKCPQHMERLVPLTTVFPDATVVITHRDPVASIQSAITMNTYQARIQRTVVRPEKIAAYWTDRYERLLSACVRDRDRLDDARTVDVYFDRFMGDSMTVLDEIYAKAGLPFDAAMKARMESFLVDNPRGKHGKVQYFLQRDFGVSAAEMRSHFRFYFDRFPVAPEVE